MWLRLPADQAELRKESALRGATVDVTRGRRSIGVAEDARNVAADARNVAADARELAVETERLARLNYTIGPGTSLDLVQTAQQRRQAETQLALKEFDVTNARISSLLASARCKASQGPTR